MKNIHILLALIVSSILLFSCSLEEEILDTATPGSFILFEEDVDFALIGAYAAMNTTSTFGRDAMWLYNSSGDDLFSTAGNASGQWAKKITINSGFGLNNALWSGFYQGVSRANSVLDYVESADVSEVFKAKARSEAYFLRGFWHFSLTQLYGDIPLVLKAIDASDDFYTSNDSRDVIYEQLFTDFRAAADNLPTKADQLAEEFGRATKEAAWGYMAKASLYYANYLDLEGRSGESAAFYIQAASYADSVILGGNYSLVQDYGALWDVNNEAVAYQEVIWSCINTRDPVETGNPGEGAPMNRFFLPNSIGNATGANNGNGNSVWKVHPWFYERYTVGDYVGDYRVERTFLTNWPDRRNGRDITTFPFPVTDLNEPQPYVFKYVDGDANTGNNHENDLFLMRLSDLYLMKAEALNELDGPTPDALAAFNALRERARMADGTPRTTPPDLTVADVPSREDFRMKIFDERGLEFIGEYNRYSDLTRMRAPDNQRTMYEFQFDEFLPGLPQGLPAWDGDSWSAGRTEPSNISYDPKWLLFPIPSNQAATNPNLVQNTGW